MNGTQANQFTPEHAHCIARPHESARTGRHMGVSLLQYVYPVSCHFKILHL